MCLEKKRFLCEKRRSLREKKTNFPGKKKEEDFLTLDKRFF